MTKKDGTISFGFLVRASILRSISHEILLGFPAAQESEDDSLENCKEGSKGGMKSNGKEKGGREREHTQRGRGRKVRRARVV